MVFKKYSELFYKKFLSDDTLKKTEKIILIISIASFFIHLLIIFLVDFGLIALAEPSDLLTNPISAIYTPFSFILIYEVYLLIYYLPKSFTIYISKQYEIISLIIIRRIFKDLSKGKYKIISFYAKRARGLMTSWILRNKIKKEGDSSIKIEAIPSEMALGNEKDVIREILDNFLKEVIGKNHILLENVITDKPILFENIKHHTNISDDIIIKANKLTKKKYNNIKKIIKINNKQYSDELDKIYNSYFSTK